MPGRRGWVLLLLAAVFSLHGVQCAAADVATGHDSATGAHSPVAGSAHSGTVGTGTVAPGHSATAAPHDATPLHDHGIWVVCLVALLTGVVLLGAAALVRGPLSAVVRGPAGSLSHVGWPRLSRAPDLSALCLLRI